MPCGWVPVQLQAQITLAWVLVEPLAGVLLGMGSNGAGDGTYKQPLPSLTLLSHAILAPFSVCPPLRAPLRDQSTGRILR